jgi:hypothetical protein
MSTESDVDRVPEYAAWLLVLVGLWTLASPFVYPVDGAAFNNTIGIGVVTTALALVIAVGLRSW